MSEIISRGLLSIIGASSIFVSLKFRFHSFFLVNFLDFGLQVLLVNKDESYIYGMLAFPLLELGRYADAEAAAKRGFEIDREDAWTHHAVSYSCCKLLFPFWLIQPHWRYYISLKFSL